ncbi:hypothetical protein ACFQ2B_34140 [Streptomyces stramineus]
MDFAELSGDSVGEADDVYCALGTTIKKAGSQDRFRAVDQHYTVAVARRAQEGGARRLALCSSIGADPGARSFYLRVKGDTEREVSALGYEQTEVFRPSLLLGHRTENRPGERLMTALAPVVTPLCAGPLRPYRPVSADRLAAAMIASLVTGTPGTRVHTWRAITALAADRSAGRGPR